MFSKIQNFFKQHFEDQGTEENPEQRVALASAALLLEVAYADGTIDEVELSTLPDLLTKILPLEKAHISELIALAKEEQQDATSIYGFTRLVNDNFSPQEKHQLLVSMWQVAFADGEIDKYEEYIIRRTADLIHLPAGAVAKARAEAR